MQFKPQKEGISMCIYIDSVLLFILCQSWSIPDVLNQGSGTYYRCFVSDHNILL